MDAELRRLLRLSRRFPRIRGFGRLGGLLSQIYTRKERPAVLVDVLGYHMALEPRECVDAALIFCPQLYEHFEIGYLKQFLQPGGYFLDAGANVGFYSLIAAGIIGPSGRALAIEADPTNFSKLTTNVTLNNLGETVILRNLGLSDRFETLRLGLNLTGNRGGNSFLDEGQAGVMVRCAPLFEVLNEVGLDHIDVAKFDIEGFEHKVLKKFLESAAPKLLSRVIIIEQNARHLALGAGDALALLREHGF